MIKRLSPVGQVACTRRSTPQNWQIRLGSLLYLIVIIAVSMSVLLIPRVTFAVLELMLSHFLLISLGLLILSIAMGLGMFGLGLCSSCVWVVGWRCRASQWLDE
jgi:hypothetical protein